MVLGMIGCLVLLSGCGTWGKLVGFTTGGFVEHAGKIKHTIAILPISNKLPWVAQRLNTGFMTDLVQAIKDRSSRIIVIAPGDGRYPQALDRFSPAGDTVPDNIALASLCHKSGINGVITGQLVNITVENQKRGILWFKHPYPMARIELEIALYDAGTAAKVLDKSLFVKVPLSDEDLASLRQNQVLDAEAAQEPLKDTASRVAKEMCNRLNDLPWEGSIVSVSAGKATLPFGKAAGFTVGDVLEVRTSGDLVVASNGSKYILPGLKTGQIRISAVSANTAEATPLGADTSVAAGDMVRFPTDR